jgi:hypothetical protein
MKFFVLGLILSVLFVSSFVSAFAEFIDMKSIIPQEYHFKETYSTEDNTSKHIEGYMTKEKITYYIKFRQSLEYDKLLAYYNYQLTNSDAWQSIEDTKVGKVSCHQGEVFGTKMKEIACIKDGMVISISSDKFDDPKIIMEWILDDVLEKPQSSKGGCLIATAAYGTELAPQVQFLREVRDNTVLSTSSGAAFMTGFNQFYYSFSPTIADWERENPLFQESVRIIITPMISSLSIMTLADHGSEASVLGFGLAVIISNIGLYVAAPTVVIFKVHKYLKSRK